MKKSFLILVVVLQYVLDNSQVVFSQNIGINATGSAPNSKALLDIDAAGSNPKGGVLLPRLTTTERDAIIPPIPHSLLIYNTTTDCFEAWNNTASSWLSFGCIGCQLPGSFSASAASGITETTFDANWTASGGATTYYLDVATDAGFTALVSGYNNLNVGNVTAYNITGLTCNTVYYYRVRAGNSCGTSSNTNTISLTSGSCFSCGSPFTDARDGKSYNTILIGSQCWMAENLAYLPSVVGPGTGSTTDPYYYVNGYNGTDVAAAKATANYSNYGVLYNWSAAMNGSASSNSIPSGVQGSCPDGWHLPSDAEWCVMENTVEAGTDVSCNINGWRGTNTGGDLKQTGTSLWNSPNTGATNTSGFTALPGSLRSASLSSFFSVGDNGLWWSSTEGSGSYPWVRVLNNTEGRVARSTYDKADGVSCRCVKN